MNNNALNIRHSKTVWAGQSKNQPDPDFVTFDTPIMGLRAGMKILQTYYKKHNLWTVWEIISRWAPVAENNTSAYALDVAEKMGVDVNEEINILTDPDKMIKMVQAMAVHENGHPESFPNWIYRNELFWYPNTIFMSAWSALQNKT